MKKTLVLVHDMLQQGYPLRVTKGQYLPEPLGRYRTVERYPLVVPFEATCRNSDCGFLHRLCGLLNQPGKGHQVEGDLFELDAEQLRLLDEDSIRA